MEGADDDDDAGVAAAVLTGAAGGAGGGVLDHSLLGSSGAATGHGALDGFTGACAGREAHRHGVWRPVRVCACWVGQEGDGVGGAEGGGETEVSPNLARGDPIAHRLTPVYTIPDSSRREGIPSTTP